MALGFRCREHYVKLFAFMLTVTRKLAFAHDFDLGFSHPCVSQNTL